MDYIYGLDGNFTDTARTRTAMPRTTIRGRYSNVSKYICILVAGERNSQAATAMLAPLDIAAPIRHLAVKQRNLTVVLAEVTGIDLKSRTVDARCPELGSRQIPFDFLERIRSR
jgi:hypothetical protein